MEATFVSYCHLRIFYKACVLFFSSAALMSKWKLPAISVFAKPQIKFLMCEFAVLQQTTGGWFMDDFWSEFLLAGFLWGVSCGVTLSRRWFFFRGVKECSSTQLCHSLYCICRCVCVSGFKIPYSDKWWHLFKDCNIIKHCTSLNTSKQWFLTLTMCNSTKYITSLCALPTLDYLTWV